MAKLGIPFDGRLIATLLVAGSLPLVGTACGTDEPLPEGPEVVKAAKAPPPISGGTLLVLRSGGTAVAADPDRDRVWIVDVQHLSFQAEVELEDGDEPGRLVEDGQGNVHVVLRGSGEIASIDVATGKLGKRTFVCAAPRGIAYDNATDLLHVACAGGELVSLSAQTAQETRRLRLDRDLRDVVVDGDRLLVSRFREPVLKVIDKDGNQLSEIHPQTRDMTFSGQYFEPRVAWRTVALPGGGAAMVHQRALVTGSETPLSISPGGYYSGIGCDSSVVNGTVAVVRPSDDGSGSYRTPVAAGALAATPSFGGAAGAMNSAILPVDMAVSPDASQVAVISAGNDLVFRSTLGSFEEEGNPCGDHVGEPVDGQPIAVAFAGSRLLVQTREPAAIHVGNEVISLPGVSVRDTGHDMFHRNTQGISPVACASCHPEGTDDGKVWNVNQIGPRRTQVLGGGLSGTLPLHWDGKMSSMGVLMDEVFVNRMGGVHQGPRNVRALAGWLDTVPAPAPTPTGSSDQIARGEKLFHDPAVACGTCHSGPQWTNSQSVDIGRGGLFQVPSLVGVAARAPFMHDGCAPTLRDRFTNASCGGGDAHGKTSQLSADEIDDLVAFLETL